jgi:CheY-like chemotaxis protein
MAGILIVDDDPTIRTMFARALGGLGEIEQAANGGDALRMLATKKYGIVLLDLHMPVMDGFVVLHTLANKPGPNKDTPIYVITADTSDQARIRALRRHAVFLLTKPVPIGTLTALVDSALKKSILRAQAAKDASDAAGHAAPARDAGREPPSSRPPAATKKPA